MACQPFDGSAVYWVLLLLLLFTVVVVYCCGSQLASGSTFVFLSTNMTTWSVHGQRVYKDSPNDYIFSQMSPSPGNYQYISINSYNYYPFILFY